MKKYSEVCLYNQRGVTILYLLGTFFTIFFVSTALIKLSHHDVMASVNYSSMASADDAARSAVEAAKAYFENRSDSAVALLNQHIKNPTTAKWLRGDSLAP